MKRIPAVLSSMAVAAILAGCSVSVSEPSSEGLEPVDLSKPSVVAALCGDDAQAIVDFVADAIEAPYPSGKRNALKRGWGVDDPSDDEYLNNVLDRLEERAATECEGSSEPAEDATDESASSPTLAECVQFYDWLASLTTSSGDTQLRESSTVYISNMGRACSEAAGVLNYDGTVIHPQIYYGDGTSGDDTPTVTVDSTTDPNTPPLLDGALRYQNITQNWGDLVERVDGQQWYKDGINARETETGFGWDEILKFAEIEAEFATNHKVLDSRVIQVFNLPGMSDKQARDAVRPYLGSDADELPIVRIDQPFLNTINVGTADKPRMGQYLDAQHMVRVSLAPIRLDDNGEPVLDEDGIPMLDMSRGAGIFIDCGNLHWIPPFVTTCTEESCLPDCPPEFPHGHPGLCKDGPERDPDPQGHNLPGGSGLAPGTGGASASGPAAGTPPGSYNWTPPTTGGIPEGSVPDSDPPPVVIEGDDPASEDDPADKCVGGFGQNDC